MKKYLYISLGLLAVALGTLGVVVPGLPTTPFFLLASWMGKYLRSYQRRGGMTRGQKAAACGIMVTMTLLSTFVFIPAHSVARIIVPIAGAVGMLVVIVFVPSAKCDD